MEIKVSNRKGKRSWRYFTSKQVEKSRVRREIESIPFEERNNVEATIFLIRLNLIGKHQTYCGKLLAQAKPLGESNWIPGGSDWNSKDNHQAASNLIGVSPASLRLISRSEFVRQGRKFTVRQ